MARASVLVNWPIDEINTPRTFWKLKLDVDLLVQVFILTVCVWVLTLGGVLRSPFGALLAAGPVFLVWQVVGDHQVKALRKLVTVWLDDNGIDGPVRESHLRELNARIAQLQRLSALPLWTVLATIVLGEVVVLQFDLPELLLGGSSALEAVRHGAWFIGVGYGTFYLSVFGVLIAGLPPERRFDLLRRVLGLK